MLVEWKETVTQRDEKKNENDTSVTNRKFEKIKLKVIIQ